MKCIKCGQEIISIEDNGIIKGFQCVNSSCEEFEQPWNLADHKDNQDWNIRHTRILEQRVQTLEALCSQMSADLKEIKDAIQDAKNT